MEIEPLKSYKTPAYPEKHMVLRNPSLLYSLPKRWKGNVKIGIALSSMLTLMLAGCGEKTAGPGGSPVKGGGTGGTGIEQTNTLDPGFPIVAPIFSHGEGRGAFGCVSVAPPAFLSEAEAYEVITEEAKRTGIRFDQEGISLDNVNIPLTSLIYAPEESTSADLKTEKGSLQLDGYDRDKKIAYEFISREDILQWKEEDQGRWTSVETYDALGAAEKLKEGLEGKTGENTVALFYDPMGFDKEVFDKYNEEFSKISQNESLSEDERNAKWDEKHRQYEDELKEMKKTLLREQVKDFLEWLKAQGII